jgi:acetate kinase
MTDAVLSLNAGSSSLKFAMFEVDPGREPVAAARGQISGIGTEPRLLARDEAGQVLADRRWPNGVAMTHEAFLHDLFHWIEAHLGRDRLIGVGHRVVHGGVEFSAPVIVDDGVLAKLDALCPLAPLHQPHNLAALRAARAVRPDLPEVACFDTAFHRTQPEVATRFALPQELEAKGVRRYGFHGLSYEYISRRLAQLDPKAAAGRVIAAHLGNGASLCAMKAGQSLDTTMGFTAVEGLVMGTRTGSLDPGVLLYLLQSEGYDAAKIEDLIYRRSGLLGVSGLSSDMKVLLESEDPKAKKAVDLFVYAAARHAGALASSLGGLDAFVFTAGIGENAPEIRARICERLAWLGVEIDPAANLRAAPVISTPVSRVVVRVIPTDEERMIALHATAAIQASR